MKKKITAKQEHFLDTLSRNFTDAELDELLRPAFIMHRCSYDMGADFSEKISRLDQSAASRCIDILKRNVA